MKLGTINRVLEWTGFVLVVGFDDGNDDEGRERAPTTVSIVWVGFPPEDAWARHCERSHAKARAKLEASP